MYVISYNGRIIPQRTYFETEAHAVEFMESCVLPIVAKDLPDFVVTRISPTSWRVRSTGAIASVVKLKKAPPSIVLTRMAEVLIEGESDD